MQPRRIQEGKEAVPMSDADEINQRETTITVRSVDELKVTFLELFRQVLDGESLVIKVEEVQDAEEKVGAAEIR